MPTLEDTRLARPPGEAPADHQVGRSNSGFGFGGFVALIAAIMACNALGIDSMLAALPQIGHDLGITRENDRQYIIAIYMFGFGVAQLVYGPLADRFGRRPILVVSMGLFAGMSIVAGLSGSFTGLLVARLLQGIAGAAGRVLTVSIVRDCYQGRKMARVMSLSFIVFMAVPTLAPSIGQIIMTQASWRFIFFFLAAFAGTVALIGGFKLRETLHPDFVRPVSLAGVGDGIWRTISNRMALGYALASTLIFGSLMGFINSVQQIFATIFHASARFPLMFACVAGSMALAALINSRIVERLGTRRVSHAALLGFIGIGALHLLVAATGHETMLSFSVLQCLIMFCFGLLGSNFGSMAMEPVGDIAGTASSIQGFMSTCGGSVIGVVIGQSFDGTTLPMALGFFLTGIGTLTIVLVTERGRLFRTSHAAECPA